MKPLLLLLYLVLLTSQVAETRITLSIRDHRFVPAEVKVAAGQKVRLMVHNQDPTPEEFESHQRNQES